MGPESKFTREIMKKLRAHPALKDGVVFKHNDFYTAGIPDLSITINSQTTWFELKVEPGVPTKLQQFYLDKLRPRSYVVTLNKYKMITFEPNLDVVLTNIDQAIELMVNLAKNGIMKIDTRGNIL